MRFILHAAFATGLAAGTPITSTAHSQLHVSDLQCKYSPLSLDGLFHLAAYPKTSDTIHMQQAPYWLSLTRVNVISPYSDRYLLSATSSPIGATAFTLDTISNRLRTAVMRDKDGEYEWGYHMADLASGELMTFTADEGVSLPQSVLEVIREYGCGTVDEVYLDDGRSTSTGGDLADSWWLCEHEIPAGQKQLYYAGASSGLEPEGCTAVSLRPRRLI